MLSDYTFAVRDGEDNDLKVVGKAYSGLRDAEILELTEKFLKNHRVRHGRVLEVPPEVVLEIEFNSIQKSTRHESGFALRFPRIRRIRRDKSIDQIDSLQRVRELYQSWICAPTKS